MRGEKEQRAYARACEEAKEDYFFWGIRRTDHEVAQLTQQILREEEDHS